MKKAFSLILLVLFSGMVSVTVYAQTPEEPISASISPENPGPREAVTIKATSYLEDSSRATYIWLLDGAELSRGVAQKAFTFQTKDAGQTSTVSVTMRMPSGRVFQKTISITPQNIDLLWEAETTVPDTYEGKALLSSEAYVRVIAVTRPVQAGRTYTPDELVYTWRINGKLDNSQSGQGKKVARFQSSLLKTPTKAEVLVTSPNGTIRIEKTIEINHVSPEIHFYNENPLMGTFYQTFLDNGIYSTDDGGILRSENYFLSRFIPDQREAWALDGEYLPPLAENQNLLEITPRNRSTGLLSREIRSVENLMQNINRSAPIYFLR